MAGPMRPHADADEAILRISATQHGLVARRQLLEAGVSGDAIDRRLRRSGLRTVHRGVYAMGPVAGVRCREMAAVLACGEDATLSHRSAAGLQQVAPIDPVAPLRVTVTGGKHPQPAGVRVHRVRRLPASEVTVVEGIRVTTVARTLCDLASEGDSVLEQALATALRNELVKTTDLEVLLRRYRNRRGSDRLRALLVAGREPQLTRSEAEVRFLEMVRRARLPAPRVNTRVESREVDFLWRTERLIVEIDGYAYHRGRGHFEDDRSRDAKLVAAGYRVMRFTWSQLDRERESTLVRLTQALLRP